MSKARSQEVGEMGFGPGPLWGWDVPWIWGGPAGNLWPGIWERGRMGARERDETEGGRRGRGGERNGGASWQPCVSWKRESRMICKTPMQLQVQKPEKKIDTDERSYGGSGLGGRGAVTHGRRELEPQSGRRQRAWGLVLRASPQEGTGESWLPRLPEPSALHFEAERGLELHGTFDTLTLTKVQSSMPSSCKAGRLDRRRNIAA